MTYSLTFRPIGPDSNGLSDVVSIKVNQKDAGSIYYNSYTDTWGLVTHLYGSFFHDSGRDPRQWKSLNFSKTYEITTNRSKSTVYNQIILEVSDLITFFHENLA